MDSAITDFMSQWGDPIASDLPFIDPILLPCGHWASKKHIELPKQESNRYCPLEQSNACKQPLTTSLTVDKQARQTIIEFVNTHQKFFKGDYTSVETRSNDLYASRLALIKTSEIVTRQLTDAHEQESCCYQITETILSLMVGVFLAWFFSNTSSSGD